MRWINKKQIIKVDIFDSSEDTDVVYRKATSKWFGLYSIEEGFYKKSNFFLLKLETIPNNKLNKNNIIYTKPSVTITLSDGEKISKYFNTNKERDFFIEKELYSNDWWKLNG